MSGFEPIVTPVHQAVSRDNETLADAMQDMVDETVDESPVIPIVDMTDLQGARELQPGQPLGKLPMKEATPEEEAERKLQEMERRDQIEAAMEGVLRKSRAENFKKRPDAHALAQAFLLEICGIDRFKHNYAKMGGAVQLVFHTPTDDQVREIGKQMVRDSNEKRSIYMPESQLDAVCYRVAMALASVQVINPVTKTIVVNYRQDAVSNSSMDATELGCLPTDLEPRKRWLYLTKHVLKTQYLTSQVQSAYDEFELLLAELILMSNEEPDFFSVES